MGNRHYISVDNSSIEQVALIGNSRSGRANHQVKLSGFAFANKLSRQHDRLKWTQKQSGNMSGNEKGETIREKSFERESRNKAGLSPKMSLRETTVDLSRCEDRPIITRLYSSPECKRGSASQVNAILFYLFWPPFLLSYLWSLTITSGT